MNRRRQPHRIPPPISHGAESLDAEIVLHEFPDDIGLCLWKTVRSVRLWGELPAGERTSVFLREAHANRLQRIDALAIDPGLRELLETAATVLRGDAVHLEAVVTACRLISAWADEQGAPGTALEFTQVAALLTPADAELVHAVARLARRRGEYARAESWYRQAIAVARRTHDWISLAGAYLGLGATFLLRGNHAAARVTLIRGIRAAERHSLREERALLSHQLAIVAGRSRRPAELVRHGRSALEAYGSDHPRIQLLAVDLAALWTRMGHYAEALRLLRGIAPGELPPRERLARAGALARAAAALGDAPGYREGWNEAEPLLDDPALGTERAEPLLDLARAAASARDDERMREAVRRFGKLGKIPGGTDQQLEAEQLLADQSGAAETREAPRKLSREGRRLVADLEGTAGPTIDVA